MTHEDEAFFLRVYAAGDYRFKGADLGILVTKGRMQTADGLTQRCRSYIEGIRSHYQSEPVDPLPSSSRSPTSSSCSRRGRQRKAAMPVIAWPTTRVCISTVPS